VDVDERDVNALFRRCRTPAEPQCRLGARVHLEEGHVAGRDLLESGERPVARPFAQRRIERLARDLDRADDARQKEGAIRTDVEVDPEDVPPRLVVDEGERAEATHARRGLPRLEIGERDDTRLLDSPLEDGEVRVVHADAR
jgi:hypothetical protein